MSEQLEPRYPLFWPTGWRRTQFPGWPKFGVKGQGVSMTQALDFLERELRLLEAKNPVISTNVLNRLDGRPYADQPIPKDPGAAVYFTLKNRRAVLACDKWNKPESNLWAVAKHIEALRGQERWGVGSVEQAFAGYMALNERTGPSCWEVLALAPGASEEAIMAAFRSKARKAHPDAPGGSHEAFAELSGAKDIALATVRSREGAAA